jgi:hypothetical protein
MKMFLFAAAAATMIVVTPTLGQAQGASPPPEAYPPYVPGTSSPYSSYDQWRHDYSDVGNCRVVRNQDVSPKDGRAISRTYLDCD